PTDCPSIATRKTLQHVYTDISLAIVTSIWASHAPTKVGISDKDFRTLNKSAIKERATTAHVRGMQT
ncbi:MAG: hypothetical protein ACK56F_19530, partial [bacterium]